MILITSFNADIYAGNQTDSSEIQVGEFAETTTYLIPKAEVEAEHQRQLEEYLSGLNLVEGEYMVIQENIVPFSDMNDYKTEWSETRIANVTGWAGNQPSGGIHISSGGTIFYSPNGGANISVSVSFSNPFGSLGISLPLGNRSGAVTGYSANIPSYGYWKLWVNNGYSVRKYIVYQRVWVDDFTGYVWREYSSGFSKSLYNVGLTPRRIS